MIPLFAKGRFSPQAHVALPAGTTEEEFGRNGFYGEVSHLYHAHPPTAWTRIEGPLKPRALDAARLTPSDATDPRGGPMPFLVNADVQLAVSRRTAPMPFWFRNADADEVHFVHRGHGVLETDFGPLRYGPGDYLVIPRGTTYRVVPEGEDAFTLVITAQRGAFRFPDRGQLGRNAYLDMGVVETPEPDGHAEAPTDREYEVVIQREGARTSVFYPFHPLDVVGWKGDLTAFRFNVRDIRPVVSPRYHLPPSVHTTLLAPGFVLCTFVPRPLESDPEALKVPFHHRNIDFDEVIFYHDGDFFSRSAIKPGMVTFHPQGIHHGPHPKAVEASKAKERTDEVAVMVDAERPLHLTPEAQAVEWAEYHLSWRKAPV